MSDNGPQLIQRAAAILRETSAATGVRSPPAQSLALEQPFQSAIERAADAVRVKTVAPKEDAQLPRQQTATVSPTSLAINAIMLPSAGSSRTVEEFRAIKREIIASIARTRQTVSNSKSRTVLVTSASPKEGKTFTAINLALALAYEKDSKVLLIDADAYRQCAVSYLGISSEYGWLDVVAAKGTDARDLIIRTNLPGLSVLPAGRQRPEIPELMSSKRMPELLDELARDDPTRFIVIDSVPCLHSTEPSILAGLAGQTVFVVAAQKTAHSEIEASLRLLNASPNVSLVLNKVHPQLTDQFKRYGYAYETQR
jgi:protein-tyrosine kinase